MIRGNLPVAVPIEPEPETFAELLVFAGNELRIQDLHRVATPEWQAQLVLTGMVSVALTSAPYKQLIESVVSQLVSIEHRQDGAFITTPLMYPSGSLVVVRVDAGQQRHFVTDMGGGYLEADMMGSSLIYARNARPIAEQAGVHFDHQAFSVEGVSREQLPGAIITIANASLQAVALAAYKQAEKKIAVEAEFLYERLIKVFTPLKVSRDVQITGASSTPWNVANVVIFERKVTVFETCEQASKFHHNSDDEVPRHCSIGRPAKPCRSR